MLKNDFLPMATDITPKKDVVFKMLFGSTESESILKDFLESILNIHIQSLSLDLATELLPEFWEGKQMRVDVRTTLSDGTQVNIEMQTSARDYNDHRCLQHWSKLYANNLKEGHKYTELRKTICIWILNEDIFPEFQDFESHWQITNNKYPEVKRFSDLEIYCFELKKFRKCDKLEPSKKNLWLWFIDHTNKEMVNMGSVTDKEIAKARKQLDKIRANPELMERIRLEEAYEMDYNTDIDCATKKGMQAGREEGLKQGIEQGIEQGSKQKQQEIAKVLKAEGLSIELIAKATGLSRDEIVKL